jgi:hypothetical protein
MTEEVDEVDAFAPADCISFLPGHWTTCHLLDWNYDEPLGIYRAGDN